MHTNVIKLDYIIYFFLLQKGFTNQEEHLLDVVGTCSGQMKKAGCDECQSEWQAKDERHGTATLGNSGQAAMGDPVLHSLSSWPHDAPVKLGLRKQDEENKKIMPKLKS